MKRVRENYKIIAVIICIALIIGLLGLVNQVAYATEGTPLGSTGYTVKGGTEGVDYEIDESAKMVVVKTGKRLTFSGTSSTYGIRVEPGTKAY